MLIPFSVLPCSEFRFSHLFLRLIDVLFGVVSNDVFLVYVLFKLFYFVKKTKGSYTRVYFVFCFFGEIWLFL